MSKPKNPNNVYLFLCKVSGEEVKTNPKQFRNTAIRYGVTDEILKGSYVSRKGRRKLAEEKLTAEQAVEKYGLHIDVARALKAIVKPSPANVTSVEVPTNAQEVQTAPAVENETPAAPEEVFYDASIEEEEAVAA